MAEDGETVTPSLPEPGVWTGMASANALASLWWKRAKIHRGSRRWSITPHKEAGYTSAVVTLGPEFAKPVAIGRGPYTSRHDNARRMTLSAPGGGLYPTSSSTQCCEPEVTAAGGIYVDVPPTGAHVDGNLVSAKGWPGRLHLRMFGGAARRSSIRINQSPQRRFHA